jgi:HAD superfamily hydrolase (TIGR01662 family)
MKAIFFDLDETLYDHRHACRMGIRRLRDTYEELHPLSVEELENEFWVMLDQMYHDVLAGKVTAEASRAERLRRLFALCGSTVEEASLEAMVPLYQHAYHVSRRAVPGACELVAHFREQGYRIAVLTNGLTTGQTDKLRACGLLEQIDVMFTSQDVGVKKPDPLVFRTALDHFGIRPEETVMIGDSWESDVLGARAAGITPIWLNRGRMECPDPRLAVEIADLADVKAIVERMRNA